MNSPKPYNRMDRINNLILSILTEINLKYIDLSYLGLVTFTKIDAAPDLKTAKVFYSVFNMKKDRNLISIEINRKRKAFKKYLGPKLNIRYTPDLKFYLDESFNYGEKISKLIKSV